jgi:hypothetical protein
MPTNISHDQIIEQLVIVLRETFQGPPEGGSYFTDTTPDAGIFGTLASLTAEQVSRPVCGTTIAAHAHHIAFGVEASAAWIEGDRTGRDWDESWAVNAVDDDQWRLLLERLRGGYLALDHAIQTHAVSSEDAMGGSIGAIAHAAYHLGAIRQKVASMRGTEVAANDAA